jgi:hypothetical protein
VLGIVYTLSKCILECIDSTRQLKILDLMLIILILN